jgi:hypothetical protein
VEHRIGFRVRTLALIGMTVAVFAAPTTAGATAPAVYSARTGAQVVLSSSGGVSTTIQTLSLPRGSWTITSNVTAVDFTGGDYVRCALRNGGTEFDGGSTTYLQDTVADLSNAGVVKTSAAAAITLTCSHDHASSSGQFYVDPGATLTAVAAEGPIKGPSADAASATVVQERTTAQVPLTPQDTAVVSARLGVGTWAVRASLSAVDFAGIDTVVCYLEGPSGEFDYQEVAVGDSDVIVSNLTVQGIDSLTKITTVSVTCYSFETDNVYIDAGATVTATLVPTPSNLVTAPRRAVTLSDTGGAPTKVFHLRMPAGAWRVSSTVTTTVANPDGSNGSETDFVRCGLLSGKKAIDGGATVLINAVDSANDGGNYEQEIVNSGTFTATKPWTLSLSCSHDNTISNGSHWVAIASSPALAIQQGPIKATVT